MNTFVKAWHLIYTKPNCEQKVAAKLIEQNIESYLPLKKVLKVLPDRRKIISKPLFPSYVFLYLRDTTEYYNSLRIPGVVSYVRVGKNLASVTLETIDSMKIAMSHPGEVETFNGYLKKGQEVTITHGPLVGLRGEIIGINGVRKILVRVNVLEQNIIINVSSDKLANTRMPVLSTIDY